ncbi:MAG: low molecular weight protein arginine phosphatase [Opitutales bacterium]|nr:low molecular weight protein arginine phosphatase [Opitutales bacterium]
MQRDSVIFLCTGNICRSPMGEGLLKHAIAGLDDSSPLKKLRVLSAGVYGEDGMRATDNAVVALKKVGVDISDHVAQTLTSDMLKSCFALFAMTRSHLQSVMYDFPKEVLPPHMMTLLTLVPGAKSVDIMDPYGYGLRTYMDVRDEIVSAIPYAIKFLERELAK